MKSKNIIIIICTNPESSTSKSNKQTLSQKPDHRFPLDLLLKTKTKWLDSDNIMENEGCPPTIDVNVSVKPLCFSSSFIWLTLKPNYSTEFGNSSTTSMVAA
jgi:hypothetical protein